MNRHHLRLGAACLTLPVLVSTCGKLFEEPPRPRVTDRSAAPSPILDGTVWTPEQDDGVLGTDGSVLPDFGPSMDAAGGLPSTTADDAIISGPSPGGSISYGSSASEELARDPGASSVIPSWNPNGESMVASPTADVDSTVAAPEDVTSLHPTDPADTTAAAAPPSAPPSPAPTPSAVSSVPIEPVARGVDVATRCGRLQVGLPDPDGWRNATWTSGAGQQMNILGLGWNSAPSIGVRVGPSALWLAVACGSTPSLELAETFVVTTCGTLRLANGSTTGTREVSWQPDQVSDARMALDGGGWTTATRRSISAGGRPFEVAVTCGPTQSLSVQ